MLANVSVRTFRIPDFAARHVLKERDKHGVLSKVMEDLKTDVEESKLSPEKLSEIHIPMFVIWGDQDKILDCRGIENFKRDVKHVKTRLVPNCGHAMLLDAVDETCDAVKSFLDRVDGGGVGVLSEVHVERGSLQERLLESSENDGKGGD